MSKDVYLKVCKLYILFNHNKLICLSADTYFDTIWSCASRSWDLPRTTEVCMISDVGPILQMNWECIHSRLRGTPRENDMGRLEFPLEPIGGGCKFSQWIYVLSEIQKFSNFAVNPIHQARNQSIELSSCPAMNLSCYLSIYQSNNHICISNILIKWVWINIVIHFIPTISIYLTDFHLFKIRSWSLQWRKQQRTSIACLSTIRFCW